MEENKFEIVSAGDNYHDQLLYYTSNSLREDDKLLHIISDRSGHPNVFAVDLNSGKQTRRSSNSVGYMKQYVYFDGSPYKGIGVASISTHRKDGSLYYLQGREVRKVDPAGKESVLNTLPDDQMTAFTHVSRDGRMLVVPTTDERALEGNLNSNGKPDWSIDQRVLDEKLNSYLFIYDTATGEELRRECAPLSWITHVQFSPVNSNHLLIEYEWPVNPGIRYLWMFDLARGKRVQLRNEEDGRSRLDDTSHTVWTFDGRYILYHGAFHNGPCFLGRVNPDGSDIREICFPESYRSYGHISVDRSGMVVTDGFYHAPGEAGHGKGEWICLMDVDWEKRKIDWRPLCRHHAIWDCQDSHPHPVISESEDTVYFTGSHISGDKSWRAVCRIGI